MVQVMVKAFGLSCREERTRKVTIAFMYNIFSWLSFLCLHFHGSYCATSKEVEQHLELGKEFLSKGRLADALTHYHAAIEGDPNNYLTYFRRATVYLAMGKSKSALQDLDKVLQMRKDFAAARVQRGNVHLRQGNLDEAYIDFEQTLHTQPDNLEALKGIDTIDPLRRDIETGYAFYDDGQCYHAVVHFSRAIEACPWSIDLRESRAFCHEQLGDYYGAIQDYKHTAKIKPDNTEAYYKISMLFYNMGEGESALQEIRECLKLDPDHKECFPHYKKVKKLVKQLEMMEQFIKEERYEDCVSKAQQALKTESEVPAFVLKINSKICHCYSKGKLGTEAIQACTEVLQTEPDNVDAYIDRAEGYLVNEQYEQAINDFQEAKKLEESQRVVEGLRRAQKLLKQSKKKDYYKILGVRRNAKKPDILKAYRKLAVQWHPDKYDGEDKKRAEQKFIDIAAAKEVLTDPEKRAKFDAGEDPLDPEAQQGGPHFHHGFNPFGHGGPFGGGQGFQFKFHFN